MGFYSEAKGFQIWSHHKPKEQLSLIPPVIPLAHQWRARQREEFPVTPRGSFFGKRMYFCFLE
jgi:hypothetical protein